MRENGAICAFLLSILVFSSFTPFTYALEVKPGQLAEVVDMGVAGDSLELQGAECSTDTLTAAEYRRLLGFANESIDFLGNRQAELDAREKAKRGIKPEVPEAEGRMVMGSNGPISIKDVVEREPVLDKNTCYLGVMRGTVAYAALLDRNYKICLASTNPECMAGALSKDQQTDLVKRLELYKQSLSEAPNRTAADEEIKRQREELAKVEFSPLNYMTTEKGYLELVSNGGNIFLLPTTLGKFVDLVKGDDITKGLSAVGAIASIVGAVQIARGGLKYVTLKIKKIGVEVPVGPGARSLQGRAIFERSGDVYPFTKRIDDIKAAGGDVAEWVRSLSNRFGNPAQDVEAIKRIQASLKTASAEEKGALLIELNSKLKKAKKIVQKFEDEGLTDSSLYKDVTAFLKSSDKGVSVEKLALTDKVTAGSATDFFNDFIKNANKARDEILRSRAGTSGPQYDALTKRYGDMGDVISEAERKLGEVTRERVLPEADVTSVLTGFTETLKKNDDAFGAAEELSSKYADWLLFDGPIITDPARAAPTLVDIFDTAEETKRAFEASASIYEGVKIPGFIPKIGGSVISGAKLLKLTRVVAPLPDIVRRALASGMTWLTGQTLLLGGAMTLTNQFLRKPFLETSVQTLTLDLDRGHSALAENPYVILDVLTPLTRSDAMPRNWAYDLITTYGAKPLLPEDAAAEKMQQIGNYVYIHDTVSASKRGNEDAIASIFKTKMSDYGERNVIISKTPAQTMVTAFEDPKNYVKDWTAMVMDTHDINILAFTDKVESWALTPFDTATKYLGSTSNAFAAAAFVGGIAGAWRGNFLVKGAIIAFAYSVTGITTKVSEETKAMWQGELVSVDKAKSSTTNCAKVVEGKEWWVYLVNYGTPVTAALSLVPGPVGIVSTAGNLLITYFGEGAVQDTLNALHECYETDYHIIAAKKSNRDAVKQDVVAGIEKNLAVKSVVDSLSALTPEVAGELQKAVDQAQEQTLNLRGELGNTFTRVLPDKTYYLYLYRAAVDWFKLGYGCDMSVCAGTDSEKPVCWKLSDTKITDDKGNVVLEKAHVRGFRLNKELQYAYLPQKVINVNKADGKKVLEVDSTGVTVANSCLRSEMEKLMGLSGLSAAGKESALKNSFGRLDVIATKEAAILFDNQRNLQVQFLEPACGQQEGSWVAIPGGKAEIYADAAGTVKVGGLKERIGQDCEFHIPTGDAAIFENGLLMPGLNGDVYNAIVYSLVEEDLSSMESFKTSQMCRLEDETPGVKLSATFRDPAMTQQYGDLLNDICMTQIRGQQNETITFEKGADGKDYMNVVDASGKTRKYQVIGYGTTMCKDSMEVSDIDTNVRQCFRGYKDQNGVPTYGFFDNQGRQVGSPIPMFWSNGMGGMMLYNPDTGKISIRNEFPLSMNPAFNTLGMMTTPYGTGLVPGLPPNGNPNAGRGTGAGGVQPNLLASLPWTPQGPELVIFLIAIAGMLIAIRVRYPERKRR